MEAQELRIGNYIQFNFLEEVETLEVDAHGIYSWNIESGDYLPIPLTEQWLIDFGFKLTYESDWQKRLEYINDERFEYTFNKTDTERSLLRFRNEPLRKIEYVHQLQNLYYSLTGEELELKQLVTV